MEVSAESVGLKELIADLQKVPEEVRHEAMQVVKTNVGEIERDWKLRWSHLGPDLPHIARSITSEYHDDGVSAIGETGPTKGLPQGRLGSFIEFGTRTSGPHPGGFAALDTQEPYFVRDTEAIRLRALE